MGKMAIPDSPSLRTTRYRNLSGVDYSVDPSEVDKDKTPDGLNMISGPDGNPEKRVGWRKYSGLIGGTSDMDVINIGKKKLYPIFDGDGESAPVYYDKIFVSTTTSGTLILGVFPDFDIDKVDQDLYQFDYYQYETNVDITEAWSSGAYGTDSSASYVEYVRGNAVPASTKVTTYQYKNDIYILFGGDIFIVVNEYDEQGLANQESDNIPAYMPKLKKITDKLIPKLGADMTEEELKIYNYVPHVMSGLSPKFLNGVQQQAVNLLTQYRCYSYITTTATADQTILLSPNISTSTDVDDLEFLINPNDVYVQRKVNGQWVREFEFGFAQGGELPFKFAYLNEEGSVVTERLVKPIVYMHRAVGTEVAGQDNIRIFFKPIYIQETLEQVIVKGNNRKTFLPFKVCKGLYNEARNTLKMSEHTKIYGYNSMDRVFLADGFQNNTLRYSAATYQTYFPDNCYIYVGSGSNILGLTHMDNKLVVFKRPSLGDVGVYYITGNYANFEGVNGSTAYFSARPTSIKMNSINEGTIKNLINEPMFLSKDGICGITTLYMGELATKNRSYKIDSKLLKEPNLENACAITYNNMYYLSVNSHCYVLDKRGTDGDRTGNTNYTYKSYYFENIDAKKFLIIDDKLMFMRLRDDIDEYELCVFNTDVECDGKYTDGGILESEEIEGRTVYKINGGEAVRCVWSTPLDDDGLPNYFKTLNKKATVISIKPYDKTSVKVKVVKNGYNEYKKDNILYGVPADDMAAREYYEGLSEIFLTVDFEKFSFDTNNSVRDIYLNKKIKKYKRLQIVLENDEAEPFGVIGITKTYSIGNLAK